MLAIWCFYITILGEYVVKERHFLQEGGWVSVSNNFSTFCGTFPVTNSLKCHFFRILTMMSSVS